MQNSCYIRYHLNKHHPRPKNIYFFLYKKKNIVSEISQDLFIKWKGAKLPLSQNKKRQKFDQRKSFGPRMQRETGGVAQNRESMKYLRLQPQYCLPCTWLFVVHGTTQTYNKWSPTDGNICLKLMFP